MTVRKTVDNITGATQRQQQLLARLPQRAHEFWVRATPIRTGNARRKTRLRGDTIEADYPYAQRLDEGYSPQAREGMSEPTQRFIDRAIRAILRK
jgi:hypothetical protein